MELKDCRLTFLVNQDGARIELHDGISESLFFEGRLSAEQLASALSRLAHTHMESASVFNLHKLNKKHEHRMFTFEIPGKSSYHAGIEGVRKIAVEKCPYGWEADLSFSSQGSFFEENGKSYARTIIRRWIDEEAEQKEDIK